MSLPHQTTGHLVTQGEYNDIIDAVNANTTGVATNASGITSEASSRASADTSEASTRAAADTALTAAIAALTPVRVCAHITNSGTPATTGAVNVASLTDNGTGDTTVTFTVAMPSANYAALMTQPTSQTGPPVGYPPGWKPGTHLAGSIRILTTDAGGGAMDTDVDLVCIGG